MEQTWPASEETKDIHKTAIQQERILAQEPRILHEASMLSARIKALPADPRFPHREPRALVVGGFVRDALLGHHPKDADIEVYGVEPDRLELYLNQLFPDRVKKAGKAFGVLKIAIGDGLDLDVSVPRRDSQVGRGHNDVQVEGDPDMTIAEAARRRDFTFNSLAADLLTGEVFDPYGGIDDLRRGLLRVTDEKTFQEDPLRVYRGIQFAARLEVKPEPKTYALLKEMVERGSLDYLKPERVKEELDKLLTKARQPSIGFELARELGIIEHYFPELQALRETDQEAEWHPEGNVWNHTMMVVDAAAKIIRQPERGLSKDEQLQVMLGALCHDLGKPSTTEFSDGRIRSKGHEEAGRKPTEALFERLPFGESFLHSSVIAAVNHLSPGALFRGRRREPGTPGALGEREYTNAVRKLLRRIHPASWKVLVAVSEADFRGRIIPGAETAPYEPGLLLAETVQKNHLDEAPAGFLIRGTDIIAVSQELGKKIRPGPVFRTLIKGIEAARDDGTIATREEGLVLLRAIVEKME